MKTVTHLIPARFHRPLLFIGLSLCALILLRLLLSVVYSGYYYTFDNDELHHSQIVYLLNNGYKPFTEIYLTVYPPYFEWLLSPVFWLKGFTFDGMYGARVIMIMLLIARIGAVSLLLYFLFGTTTALLFAPIMLSSTFVVFTEMQIRPDNLMLTVCILGFTLAVYAWRTMKTTWFFLAGFFLLWSVLILMKVLPGVATSLLVMTGFLLYQKRWSQTKALVGGAILAVITFSVPFLLTGTFQKMIQQVFIESIASYSGVFENPIPFMFFYHPSNPILYGLHGKPPTWMLNVALPLLGAAGWFSVLHTALKEKLSWSTPVRVALVAAFAAQWGFLLYIESAFLQHYMTVNWFYAAGAAIVLGILASSLKHLRWIYIPYIIGLLAIFIVLTETSVKANTSRATNDASALIRAFKNIWVQIPENETTFPNVLFRPLAYPVPHGHFIGNMPPVILNRLPSIPASLEKHKNTYVYLDEYYFNHLPVAAQEYITANYTRSQTDPQLYVRNKK